MSEVQALAFRPDYVIPPGEFLQELLDTIGMSQTELAHRRPRPVGRRPC